MTTAKYKIETRINKSAHIELLDSKAFCYNHNFLEKLKGWRLKKKIHMVIFGILPQKEKFSICASYNKLHESSSMMYIYTTSIHFLATHS